ncbi:MAG: hypothetical protein ACTSP3_11110 [Candidatus Heimdallarchaeaceae archaeon]
MDEFRVSLFKYLPMLEILWNKSLRKPLEFLKSNVQASKVIYQSFSEGEKDKVNHNTLPFVPQIGPFYLNINKDCYIYLRNLKYLIRDDQPIRPIIPLSTSIVKWKKAKRDLKQTFNQNLVFKLYPNLVGEIEKSYSVSHTISEHSFKTLLEKSKEIFNQEQNQEKERFMDAVFESTEGVNLFLSDLLVIIECTAVNCEKLGLIQSVFDAERIKGGWIKELKHNYWLIIYGNPKPSKKFRERIITALKLPFLLRVLGKRIQYLLEIGKEDEFGLREKLSYYEFIISVLNPDYYYSKERFSFLLPKNYQRAMFNKVSQLLKLDTLYNSVKKVILKRIENWEHYEQYAILSKRNIVLNQIKEELSIKFKKCPSVNLTRREVAVLSLFRREFLRQFRKEGFSRRYAEKHETFAGKTKNFLVENIRKWLKDNGYEENLISQTELKEPYPTILRNLVDRDLLIRTPIKESSSHLYSLNLENEFIKKFVFEK